jgi:hypothetical protein
MAFLMAHRAVPVTIRLQREQKTSHEGRRSAGLATDIIGTSAASRRSSKSRGLSFVLNMRMRVCVGWLIDAP